MEGEREAGWEGASRSKSDILNASQTVTDGDLGLGIGFWSRGKRAQKEEERRLSVSVTGIELGGGYMKDSRCYEWGTRDRGRFSVTIEGASPIPTHSTWHLLQCHCRASCRGCVRGRGPVARAHCHHLPVLVQS